MCGCLSFCRLMVRGCLVIHEEPVVFSRMLYELWSVFSRFHMGGGHPLLISSVRVFTRVGGGAEEGVFGRVRLAVCAVLGGVAVWFCGVLCCCC